MSELIDRYNSLGAKNLKLDMTRGKPCSEQLDLSNSMLAITDYIAEDGSDCRNYGHLTGLPEARRLFAEYLGTPYENTWVLGNSSLSIMHDLVTQAMLRSVPCGGPPWSSYETYDRTRRPIMLCPVPGYDRHFTICERNGIDMVQIPLQDDGPDMRAVEFHAGNKSVVGMWCTPKYSNPSGTTYSAEVCSRLATMRTRNWGFRIFWDLAYNAHDLMEPGDPLPNFLDLCKKAGNEHRPLLIGSTSKISFAGGGLGIFAASEANLEWFHSSVFSQTIGGDKLNQLRHVKFFRSMDGIRSHMRQHAALIRPKFKAALEVFERELRTTDTAIWNEPQGGYFIALRGQAGLARKTIELAGKVGVKLTPAGATHPYGIDQDDAWIRFAPTFPPLEEVRLGAEVLCVCQKLAAQEAAKQAAEGTLRTVCE